MKKHQPLTSWKRDAAYVALGIALFAVGVVAPLPNFAKIGLIVAGVAILALRGVLF